jgi:hypothetical protein
MIFKEVIRIHTQTGRMNRLPDMNIERCGMKAQISNNRLYVIGGGNNRSSQYKLTDSNEYFDFKSIM